MIRLLWFRSCMARNRKHRKCATFVFSWTVNFFLVKLQQTRD